MTTDAQLENYLSNLDRALSRIAVSERAEIVTEIKSHVLEASQKDPSRSLSSILESMGEAETVANRYLMERGLQPVRPPKTPMLKWLTIGFLGTLGILVLFVLTVIWKFTPLIKVDDKAGRVSLLGGMIDVSDADINVGSGLKLHGGVVFHGSKELGAGIRQVRVPFKSGNIVFSPSKDRSFEWDCKVSSAVDASWINEKGDTVELQLDRGGGAHCTLQIPAGVKLVSTGVNGRIELMKPQGPVEIHMTNGNVSISPDSQRKYRYVTQVERGKVDGLDSSSDPHAIEISISLVNGRIGTAED